MSEMVERAARAICRSLEVTEESWPDHVDEARAAIDAIREPNAAMLAAAQTAWLADPERKSSTLWRAMIDEVLK